MSTSGDSSVGLQWAGDSHGDTRVKILLVDDEARNLDVLESVLVAPEYNLVRALTAEAALMLLLEGDFAVIVLDIQMPGMTGIELATIIKQRKRTQHIPIIFLTSYYQEEKDILEGYESGAIDYLTKPINPQILKSKVAVTVDLYQKTRALAATNAVLEQEVAHRQKAEKALLLANNDLETRVKDRTSELLSANEELRKREAALRDSQAQLQLVTDHAPVFLIQCDREHRLKFTNRTFAERFGFDHEQLAGQPFSKVIGDEAYEIFRHQFDATLDGRHMEFEANISHPAFGNRWIHVVQEPERGSRGEVVGLVAVISDITDRKLVEKEIMLARDKALAASRAKDDFLARLSHELRTPLNPVLLLASDAANDHKLPEDVRADFEMIAQNITMEARLIDDLLDISRIAHGKLVIDLHPFDVHVILRDAMKMVQSEIALKHFKVVLKLDAARHMALCDDVRLKQVFWNLLKNAIKFTPEGGSITIETQTIEESDNIAISVTDSGIGMTPAEIGRIFEAFSQGDHSSNGGPHKFGGLGLGLVISQMLVEQHSGFVSASSPGRGQGATFLVELPLFQPGSETPQPADPGQASGASVPHSTPRSTEGTRRVLLVEDHKPTRNALTRLLLRRKYEVVSAGSASEARAAIGGEPFDLLISDIGLPDGTGYDLMTEFRARGVIGIALTGFGMDEDVDRSQAAGFSGHLTKPVSVQGLDCAIAAALGATAEQKD
ncbi:MAG TPA: response regulator [Opitutaceae bacterium]|jgi:PAS domain S-box-containing protein|nr:response regulator [Opitutaceae bacterium]